MRIFHFFSIVVAWAALNAAAASAHRVRTPIDLPDVPGYITLKGDFHLHTVFSDGLVWPSIRAEEAWRDGLDAIAITDHIEYQPHKHDVSTNHNRSHEIARDAGAQLEVLVVKGSEVTRQMPPGHLNALFLTNSEALAVPDWRDALQAAQQQGAFIFWNHPGWEAQAPEGKAVMYPEHKELISKGLIRGIEVVNGRSYYPEAHRWAIEHKLTLFSNSDAHNPSGLDYPVTGDFRPVTLVFAKTRTLEGLREAFEARRTAVYSQDRLIGDEGLLRPIFEGSVRVVTPRVRLPGTQRRFLQVHNDSSLKYELELRESTLVNAPRQITLPAGKTALFQVSNKSQEQPARGQVTLTYAVKNLLCGPDEPLLVKIVFEAI